MNSKQYQTGFVSIVVSIVLMSIIALMATGFALLSRRESRQALDRQLSTQAFYAAESGINEAIVSIQDGITDIPTCYGVTSIGSRNPDLGNGQKYTCVLVTQAPNNLQFGPVTTNDSKVVKVQASDNIDSLRISWQDFGGKTTFAPSTGLALLPQQSYNTSTPSSYANNTGILRVNIIPVTQLNRANITDNTQTLFLYPRAATAGVINNYSFQTGQTPQGQFIDGKCNINNIQAPNNFPHYCNVNVTNTGGLGQTKVFYLRLKSIYRSSRVTIQAFNNSNPNTPLQLYNGQVIIDATGKASDVLRRVQVRIPYNQDYQYPEAAIQTTDSLCKKLDASPSSVVDSCTSQYVSY